MQRVVVSKQLVANQLRLSSVRALTAAPMRFKGEVLGDKEKGDERIYFNKNDGKYSSSNYTTDPAHQVH